MPSNDYHGTTMESSFEQLQQLVVLSGEPVETGKPSDWSYAHNRLGRSFPNDYVQFVSVYGHCLLDGEVEIMTPFRTGGRFWEELEGQRALDRMELIGRAPNNLMVEVPRPKAMIPWGASSDGASYYWVTQNRNPNEWTVFMEWDVYSAHYPTGMVEFLVHALRSQDGFALGALGSEFRLPVYADPVVPTVTAELHFRPEREWNDEEVAILAEIFGTPPPGDRNWVIARPMRWRLVWGSGWISITVPSDEIDRPKSRIASLRSTLGLGIISATPESWADLVN